MLPKMNVKWNDATFLCFQHRYQWRTWHCGFDTFVLTHFGWTKFTPPKKKTWRIAAEICVECRYITDSGPCENATCQQEAKIVPSIILANLSISNSFSWLIRINRLNELLTCRCPENHPRLLSSRHMAQMFAAVMTGRKILPPHFEQCAMSWKKTNSGFYSRKIPCN